ncbi:iron uptake protein [Xylophilus sp.]|uniref:iron uptake protein n=1 Tax=Xylophilus sp. TaxID=2653893 RepID=UPI0013BD1E52|nr:iron uptake protein [Xylophilus sp.]KAF1042926.1 MAG: hypothetical protein GAK38_04143 [Xylophilus sp.]
MASNTASAITPLHIVVRIATATLGGYLFTWGFAALAIGLLFAAGLEFHDAEALAAVAGFLVFLTVFCWAFAARSLPKFAAVLVIGGAAMTGAASLVQRALL